MPIPLLRDLLLLLLASVPIVFIFRRLRVPAIVGFMITGVVIGPHGFALIRDVHAIEVLAEIGVALLLFTIGLEFSLRRLLDMKRLVLLGGGLQVASTILLAMAIAYLLGRPFAQAVFFGFLFALSSTAIVLKSYIDRAEIDAPHGRANVGILLFQDLSIVPMMLMVPILSGTGGVSVGKISITLGIALATIAAIIFTARTVVPGLLYQIVRLRSPELFIISVVLLSLGTSWLTSQVGLTLALGAFIAGLVLSESDYSHQIVADILPFRDVFNSIFFMSIGMLLSMTALSADFLTVLAWVAALTIGKALLAFGVVRLLGYSLRVSTMTALGLAQIGEFSFILAETGVEQNMLSEVDYQRFLAASILSMIAAPFLIRVAPRIGYAVQSMFSPDSILERSMAGFNPEVAELRDHVIIIGYGLNGRNLAKVLRRTGIPYVVLELNAEAVREGSQQGEPIVYGDATRKEVLNHVHLGQARVLVLAISDPAASRHTVSLARQMNPEIHIIVRTRYMTEISDLRMLGADEVIPEEFETGIEIFSRVLRKLGIGRHAIQHQVEEIRSEGYEMLRTPSLPVIDLGKIAEALSAASTESVQVEPGAPAAGKTIAQLRWRTLTGVSIIAIINDGNSDINPGPDTMINEGDTVVLIGTPEKVEQAIEKFLIKSE